MASLLIEIQTEELPPKALDNLSKAFAKELAFSLKEQDLALPNAQVTAYGSPRRIAALISDVSEVAPDKPFRQKLVPVKVGLDAEGKATPALSKKMKALGIECEPSELKVVNDGKQDQLVYEGTKAGVSLKDGLQIALDHAVRRLPIPKVMSYQLENGKTVEFVRPVKHLVALFDKEIVPVELFGLKAGRETMGHRFHVKEPISIKEAEKYAEQMEKEGKIVASFEERKNKMVGELKSAAEKLNAEIIMPDDLVNEVAALTEWPVVYESGFDEEFLTVPAECLILTMQQNQKYFALRDKNKKLMNRFLLVSQIEAKDGGEAIRSGNARVVRARLADAKFFYDQEIVNAAPRITLKVSNVSLQDVLERITLQTKLYFNRDNHTISVGKQKIGQDTSKDIKLRNLKGRVVDQNGEPIIGASVLVKGTANGVITDMDGNYNLINVPENALLAFSYIGYQTVELKANGKGLDRIMMKEDNELLDEVVVVGLSLIHI